MTTPDHDLDALFKRLHLANARRVWRDLVQRAEREAWAYGDFLTLLVTEEIAHRQQTRLGRLTRRAHFPFLKTIDDFNFTYQSTLRLHMLGSALAPDFVTEGRSLIFAGKPGRGKTHLAIAIAYRAIQNGFDAFFTTAATLIDDLSAAFRDGQLANALQTYTHPAVLVVDEVGYLTYGTDAANMLFHVVNERHRRRRSMIFTTNKALKAWGRVLHDEDLGQAIIDRVLEHGRLIRLDGPSIRTLHLKLDDALKEESDQEDEVARISGIKWPEFPEPTATTPFCLNEALSILKGKWQRKKISEDDYFDATRRLVIDVWSSRYHADDIDFMNPAIYQTVEAMARRHQLDLSDALQLVTIQKGFYRGLVSHSAPALITADQDLASAAVLEHIRVWHCNKEARPAWL
jgi:DNA replication protein DnaC